VIQRPWSYSTGRASKRRPAFVRVVLWRRGGGAELGDHGVGIGDDGVGHVAGVVATAAEGVIGGGERVLDVALAGVVGAHPVIDGPEDRGVGIEVVEVAPSGSARAAPSCWLAGAARTATGAAQQLLGRS